MEVGEKMALPTLATVHTGKSAVAVVCEPSASNVLGIAAADAATQHSCSFIGRPSLTDDGGNITWF